MDRLGHVLLLSCSKLGTTTKGQLASNILQNLECANTPFSSSHRITSLSLCLHNAPLVQSSMNHLYSRLMSPNLEDSNLPHPTSGTSHCHPICTYFLTDKHKHACGQTNESLPHLHGNYKHGCALHPNTQQHSMPPPPPPIATLCNMAKKRSLFVVATIQLYCFRRVVQVSDLWLLITFHSSPVIVLALIGQKLTQKCGPN